MKRDVQAAERSSRTNATPSTSSSEALPNFNKGTQQYAEMEEQIADKQAKLALMSIDRRTISCNARPTIYHNVYQEILAGHRYFCRQHSIDMVLRFNGETVDVQKPDSVLTFINRPVVWYDPGLDITDFILNDVNRPTANRAAADAAAAMQPPSPFRQPQVTSRQVAHRRPRTAGPWARISSSHCHGRLAPRDATYTKATNDSRPRHCPRRGILERKRRAHRVSARPGRHGHCLRSRRPAGLPADPRHVDHCFETPRRTTLRCGDAAVEMIEHIMAALAGLQIDNCELWVDQPEMPGCDGSSLPFVAAPWPRRASSSRPPRGRRKAIRRVIHVGDENSWIEARPCCSGKMVLRYELDYGSGSSDRTPIAGSLALSTAFSRQLGSQPDISVAVGGRMRSKPWGSASERPSKTC